MVSQSSDPPASPPAEPPKEGDGEPARIKSLDERFGAIESEQASQRGLLEQIRDTLTGGHHDGDGDGQTAADEPAGGAPNIGAEVRRQIEAANQRRAAEEKDAKDATWRKGIEDAIEALKPEQAPREPQSGVRGRLQRVMFGRPD